MNKRIKAEWIKALRSGKYKQGRYQLCDSHDRMCCLGVLYDACIDGDWVYASEGPRIWCIPDEEEICSGFLPRWLGKKLGLPRDVMEALAAMNDSGQSFAEIAAYIEANL